MFDDGSYLETRQFTVIHKIVLGLLPYKNLDAELQASTSTINDVDICGRSALSWAAERADISALQPLLTYGAETASPDNGGAHPLHYAASARDPASLQILLEHGAEVDCRNAYGHTPLQWASRTQDDNKFLLPLIVAGADINAGDFEGETALMYAARNERVEVAASLLAHGADVNARTIWGLTALDLCVRYNCHHMLKYLLARRPDYDSKDIHGQSVLHQAAKDGDLDTISALMDTDDGILSVLLDGRDLSGKTAWDYLEDRNDAEVTKLFEDLREGKEGGNPSRWSPSLHLLVSDPFILPVVTPWNKCSFQ